MAKKILLTGGSGMVGRGIQDHPASSNWEILAPSSKELNLMESLAVEDYIAEQKPDLIIHAAGKVGGIRANIAEPVAFLDCNVMIGRNVIMGAYKAGVKNLINLASTCVYPREAPNPLHENLILKGELEPTNEGYAIAKIVALRLCQYIRSENPEYIYKTLIPCNLYGLYDKFDLATSHLIPAIIHKMHDAKQLGSTSVDIWGDGTARREFMYSADLADAVFFVVDKLEEMPDIMNAGIGHDHSINEYYELVADVVGWEGTFQHDISKPVGMMQKLSDTTRQNQLGWRPKTPLAEGIAKTYRHYLEILTP